jgi:hypothetical protein
MTLINATPHEIHLILETGYYILEKSGILPRVNQSSIEAEPLQYNGLSIPIKKTEMGNLEGLPPEAEGVYYIVSLLVLEAGKKLGRKDLFAPDTVRDEHGNIKGAKGFIQ